MKLLLRMLKVDALVLASESMDPARLQIVVDSCREVDVKLIEFSQRWEERSVAPVELEQGLTLEAGSEDAVSEGRFEPIRIVG